MNLFSSISRTLLIATLCIPTVSNAYWVQNGSDAMYSMDLPQAKKPDTAAIIVVGYAKKWQCRPIISVLMISSKKLGTPERQQFLKQKKDHLIILVDGKSFSEETNLTMYSNGMELAMFAPPELIKALSQNPTSVIAKLGSNLGGFDFSDGKNFAKANTAAASECK